MSLNWKRQIQIYVGGRIFNSDDYDLSFKTIFDVGEEPNDIELKINNLSVQTISEHFYYNSPIVINAGYVGDIGNVAKGILMTANTTKDGTEKVTTVTSVDASAEYLNEYISKTYRANTTASEILDDLLNQINLTVGEIQLVKNVQYPKGRSVTGKIRDIIYEIIGGDCNTNVQIINGVVMIRPIKSGIETGFVLNKATGLIGSPEKIISNTPPENTDVAKVSKGDDVQKKIEGDYKVKCLLNHRITALTRLKIESKTLNAFAVVLRGVQTGTKDSDFITEMEVKII